MDLRQLAALLAVQDHGTFSAAAASLHTVQSNVSSHIARLERELGATLVDRAGGRLTEEGVAVAERARRVQGELAAVAADLAALRSDVRGDVRLGVLGTTGRWVVPRLVSAVADRHPGIALTVVEGTSAALLPQLEGGRLDLALLTLPALSDDVSVAQLFDEDLLLVVPEDDPLATRERVGLADLAGVPLLLPPPGTTFRAELDEAAAAAGVELRAKAVLDGVRLLASLCFEGWAAGIVPASAVPGWLEGPWRVVEVEDLPRRCIGLARRSRGLLTAPARAVSTLLAEVVADGAPDQPGIHVA